MFLALKYFFGAINKINNNSNLFSELAFVRHNAEIVCDVSKIFLGKCLPSSYWKIVFTITEFFVANAIPHKNVQSHYKTNIETFKSNTDNILFCGKNCTYAQKRHDKIFEILTDCFYFTPLYLGLKLANDNFFRHEMLFHAEK